MGEPFVSIVTPFYNTDAYLAECIESVLRQTHGNYEYLLVNNQSTDRSLSIAQGYARKDPRIRILDTPEFLTQGENYNFALTQICEQSLYCKIVQADDWIYPECVQEMVALAEETPSVGVVGSYHLAGTELKADGLPYARRVFPGAEVCRLYLVHGVFLFGSPTSVLYRSSLVRQRRPFFVEGTGHEDTEAVFELLESSDFGFVHKVLTYTRVENESLSTTVRKHDHGALGRYTMVRKYGRVYLTPEEYEMVLQRAEGNYFSGLAQGLLRFQGAEFWRFHRDGLEAIGERLTPLRLAKYVGWELLDLIGNPKKTVGSLLRGIASGFTAKCRRDQAPNA